MFMNKVHPKLTLPMPVNFILTFLFGLALALGFSILVSYTTRSGPSAGIIHTWLNNIGVNPTYLSLTIAGMLGGLLYSILLDQTLELPTWNEQSNGIKPGFLGEIFVGIGGSFIAYVALPDSLKIPSSGPLNQSGILIFVTGLVGGYGGKAILDAALDRVTKRIKEADLAKERAETEVNVLEERKNLLTLINQQIQEGLNSSELLELQEKLEVASPEVKERAFILARDARRLGRRATQFKDRVKRTVPIFETLLASDNNNPECHAQLAYAEIDLDPPALDDAIFHLNQAIQLRGESIQGNTWEYELHRATARILILKQQGIKAGAATPLSGSVLLDLSVVEHNKGLKKAIDEYKVDGIDLPIEGWLTQNQDWVSQQTNGKALLDQIKLTPLTKTVNPSVNPSAASSVAPESISSPPPQALKNGSAREAINQLPRISAGTSTNTGTLRAAVTRSAQGSATATATKVQPDRWDVALTKAPTSGASTATAKNQIGMPGGMAASIKMAEKDWVRIQPIVERFYIAALKYDVPPALLAAIASRESHVGTALKNGLGDRGNAFGIMQVDKRFHSQAGASGDPANQIHINQGAEIFNTKRKEVTQKHRDWGDEYILKGATAAYNVGSSNIQTKTGIDRGTTGNDYGSDVIARAQCYSKRMKSLAECKAKQTSQSTSSTSSHTEEPDVLSEKGKAATESSRPGSKVEVFREVPKNLTAKDINWSDMSAHLTPHFMLGENLQNDTRRIPHDTGLQNNILIIMRELQKIRDDYGKPIIITSGYRPERINRTFKGAAKDSQHIKGIAVDICPAQGDMFAFQKWVDQHWYGALGWGAKKGFVHIDCRNGKGWKTGGEKGVRWNY